METVDSLKIWSSENRTTSRDFTSLNWTLSEIAGPAGTGSSFKLTKAIITQQEAGRSRAKKYSAEA